MEARCFQDRSDPTGGHVEVDIASAVEGGAARSRRDQSNEHAERGGLARTVGPEKARDRAGAQLQGEIIDGGDTVEAFGEAPELDCGHELPPSDARRRSPVWKEA